MGIARPYPRGVHVEIWSDIACPWCAIGKRRFESALAAFPRRDEVTVTWRSFELDPAAPHERGDLTQHLADKYGLAREEAAERHAQMTALAAEEGLPFRFDRGRAGSTFDAHRLTHLAAEHGRQDSIVERLMRAYLEEGRLVSDHGTLVALAAEAGVPAEAARDALAGDAHATAVREDEQLAAAIGIRGVPFFVADRRFG